MRAGTSIEFESEPGSGEQPHVRFVCGLTSGISARSSSMCASLQFVFSVRISYFVAVMFFLILKNMFVEDVRHLTRFENICLSGG